MEIMTTNPYHARISYTPRISPLVFLRLPWTDVRKLQNIFSDVRYNLMALYVASESALTDSVRRITTEEKILLGDSGGIPLETGNRLGSLSQSFLPFPKSLSSWKDTIFLKNISIPCMSWKLVPLWIMYHIYSGLTTRYIKGAAKILIMCSVYRESTKGIKTLTQ